MSDLLRSDPSILMGAGTTLIINSTDEWVEHQPLDVRPLPGAPLMAGGSSCSLMRDRSTNKHW